MSNSGVDHVTRFPAADPSKVENFKTGFNNSGLDIDSQGNVWVTEPVRQRAAGHGPSGRHGCTPEARGCCVGIRLPDEDDVRAEGRPYGGSVTLLRPDGTPYPGSPFTGGGLPGPWAVVVDGNDNVWISNFAMPSSPIVQLCGVRTENCPPGMKTGDQISPPGGYVGGGLQMQTDIAIDPAGNVWVMNNWQDIDSCYRHASRGAFDPLRRPGRRDLLRHGQAGARAADRTGASALGKTALGTATGHSQRPLWVRSGRRSHH